MNLSLRALRSLVPDLSGTPEELADRLRSGGIRVERIAPLRELLEPIVTARVESVEAHPNADRLRICRVNDGSGQALQIVTGASNVEAGADFPLFRVGTSLPNGTRIRKGKLRGEPSEGMLASEIELEIGDEKGKLMRLSGSPAPGTPLPRVVDVDGVVFMVEGDPSEEAVVAALTGRPVPTSPSAPAPVGTHTSGAGAGQGLDFIRTIVAEDLRAGRHERVVTRFPPEPNGFLHIGHAKSIVLNFGIAAETGGACNLRFDDTNPETEDAAYVESIQETVRWLGGDWGDRLLFASDYFERMYDFAEHLVREGKAYVEDADEETVRAHRGSITEPGRPTPSRARPADESLALLRRMRAGELPDGSHVLRARIDLGAANLLLRDPILYRIRHAHHYRTGDRWPIYPLYDFAHPLEDAIEGVTHSLCTLEFETRRPLYDWVVEEWRLYALAVGLAPARPRQYEFARLNLDYTIMSKRKLLELVKAGDVSGWDDPRMPTIAGLRRRGFTPEAIRAFCEMIGVAKTENRVDIGKLEFAVRDDLNPRVPRVLCVPDPLKVVLTNYPEGRVEELEAPYYPHDVPKEGSRTLPFSRELYIDRADFMEDPPKGYFRLAPGGEVRLRYGYVITCEEVVKDDRGEITELRCSYDPETRGGNTPDGRVVKGTIQWLSAAQALPCELRLYDRLFRVPAPEEGEEDFRTYLNPESLVVVKDARVEPSVREDPAGSRYQFERLGYFCSDPVESTPGALVFNRTVTLRDSWAKAARRDAQTRHDPSEPSKERKKERKKEPRPPRSEAPAAEIERSPELESRRRRYVETLGIAAEEAEILTRDLESSNLFEAALGREASAKAVANWVIHELPREIPGQSVRNLAFTGADFGRLVALAESDVLNSSAAREVLSEMVRTGEDPDEIVERRGLRQVSDADALAPAVEAVLAENAAKADEYRGGKVGLLGFFVGQVMRRTGGKANPEVVQALLRERLGA